MKESLSKVKLMGILNVTPDSFSDGGMYLDPHKAVDHCLELIEDGADIVDIGAESTRPWSDTVSEDQEWSRLEPVLKKLAQSSHFNRAAISIDTRRESIALRSVDYGITYINSVSGLFSQNTLQKLSSYKDMNYVAMHMPFDQKTMQQNPMNAQEASADVTKFFNHAQLVLKDCGFKEANIFMDCGIGFGKTWEANLTLINKHLKEWASQYNLAVGVSRKAFLSKNSELNSTQERDLASREIEINMIRSGVVKLVRTHNVKKLKSVVTEKR